MDQFNGAEAAVRMLQLNGVRHIFGLCGDTSLPFYDALYKMEHGMTHVLTRDERSAAYMADGYARVTGKPGICEGPSGGGATYLIPGLVEANESCIPVLGITSDVPVLSRGRYPLTELDQDGALPAADEVEHACATAPSRSRRRFRSAFREMTTGPSGRGAHRAPVRRHEEHGRSRPICGRSRGTSAIPRGATSPSPRRSKRRARRSSKRARRSSSAAAASSSPARWTCSARSRRCSNAPVCTTVSGKGSLSERHPLCAGVVGANGGVVATREVVQQADLVVFIGCRAGSTTTEHWKNPSREIPIVHIDVDPSVISANYQTAHAVVGDARLALEGLHAFLSANVSKRARTRVRRQGGRRARAQDEVRRVREARERERAADTARARARRAPSRAAEGRDRRRRSRHAVSLRLGLLRSARAGTAVHHQPRARRARLLDVGGDRRVVRTARRANASR